jgi:hypothetical protein
MDKYIQSKTGKYPALFGIDLGDFDSGTCSQRYKVRDAAIHYGKNRKAIVTMSYHLVQPDQAECAGFSTMHIGNYSSTKIDQILTNGHSMQVEHFRRLDQVAGYLKDLENQGVVVLWRPFHEMNGNWFWWSHQAKYKDLWIQMWNRLVNHHQLKNILFVWGPNWWASNASGYNLPDSHYPGSQYVDIVGVDIYKSHGHNYDQYVYNKLNQIANGKPLAISENGEMPNIATLKANQPNYVMWCTWHGYQGADKGNTDALYSSNFGNSLAITLDELPNFDTYTPPTGTDAISAISGPSSVTQGSTQAVQVTYSASTNRTINVTFQLNASPWTTYGSASVNVSAGSGTATLNVPVASNTPVGSNYKWQSYLSPTGGNWDNRVADRSQINVSCATSGGGSTHTTYQAESATLTGVSTATAKTGYSGTGYVNGATLDANGDKISWTVNVPSAGNYELIIRYHGEYGTKTNDLWVNNVQRQQTSYAGTSAWTEKVLGNYALNAGNNTIELRKNWGWMHVDYLKVSTSLKSTFVNLKEVGQGQYGFKVYPNPVVDHKLILSLPNDDEAAKIRIFDMNGRTLMVKEMVANNQTIDLQPTLKGTYFIEIKTINKTEVKKLVVY